MPLSDHERRLLAEMEEALSSEDPRLVSALSGKGSLGRSLFLGAALLCAGFALLLAGLISHMTILGVVGFITALGGVLALVRSLGGERFPAPKRNKERNLGDRLQRRWDQRNNQ